MEKAYALHHEVTQSGTELQCKLKNKTLVLTVLTCQANNITTYYEEIVNV